MRGRIFQRFFCFLFLFFFYCNASSQNVALIHLKKDSRFIFFQKGAKSDSIVQGKSDLFYLLIPDSLKKEISVLVENGRLQPTGNDSLVKFVYLQGLKYESLYLLPEDKKQPALTPLINGTSTLNSKQVRIQFFYKKEGTVFLDNLFLYRSK